MTDRRHGFAEIPYEKVIEVRDPLPHSENIKPPNFFELLVKDTDYSEMWIEELDLSIRAFNCMKRAGKDTVQDLIEMTEEDYMKVRNLGRRSFEEIKEKLRELGLSIKPGDD